MDNGFHSLIVLNDFLIVPVPEQGASTSILSNSILGSCFFIHKNLFSCIIVIIEFLTPHLCRFIPNAFNLIPETSLATIIPLFCIYIAIWLVFDPGAAQRSRTLSPGLGSRTTGGIIDADS